MDDSDRPRDEQSAPEDDSVADDAASESDGTASDAAPDEEPAEVDGADASSDAVEPDTVDDEPDAGAADDTDAESTETDDSGDPDESSDDVEDEADAEDAEDDVDAEDAEDADDDAEDADADDGDADVDADDDADADEDDTDGDADEDDTDGDADEDDTDGENATVVDDTDDDVYEGLESPETDEEMPLAAHIEEMMRRLAVVFLFGGLATLVVVTESTELINYFWSYHIPEPMVNRPRLYGPLELPLTRLKVAGLAGVVVGLPAFVYETYRFMKPGLYENERRYYLAAVPTSLVLGGIGIAFAHFLVLPAIFSYFTTYTSDAATIAFGLAETFNLIVIMLAFMAIVFQIPLFIMLAIMMNLVTRQWLEAKRLIFWGSFLGIAFLFSPDPTGMAPIIVTLTMIVLYEGTLAVLRWTGN